VAAADAGTCSCRVGCKTSGCTRCKTCTDLELLPLVSSFRF
jgi:hypothetical protein